jgi:hypothetical protein
MATFQPVGAQIQDVPDIGRSWQGHGFVVLAAVEIVVSRPCSMRFAPAEHVDLPSGNRRAIMLGYTAATNSARE